jgi:hypothetical protein
MGGTIEVESQLGKGSLFNVTMLLPEVTAAKVAADAESSGEAMIGTAPAPLSNTEIAALAHPPAETMARLADLVHRGRELFGRRAP